MGKHKKHSTVPTRPALAARSLSIDVGCNGEKVAIRLSRPTNIVVLSPQHARSLAEALLSGARQAEVVRPPTAAQLAQLTQAVGGPEAMVELLQCASAQRTAMAQPGGEQVEPEKRGRGQSVSVHPGPNVLSPDIIPTQKAPPPEPQVQQPDDSKCQAEPDVVTS